MKKKFILSISIIVSFGFYTIWNNINNPPSLTTPIIASLSIGNDRPYSIATNSSIKTLNKIYSIGSSIYEKNSKKIKTNNSTKQKTSTIRISKKVSHHKMMNMMNKYKDGSYLGKVTDAYYGNLQVKAIIVNGRLVDIKMLDYPHNGGNSIYINSYALPILRREAIRAQSAKVNAVSGASETSPAFKRSLLSALLKARI